MQEITTEIEISASPSKVWSLLIGINKWHEWNPIINKSSGLAALGSKVNITMMGKEEGKDGPSYSPEIIQFDKPNLLRWRATMMAEFIFTNEKVFELVESTKGTKLIHKEQFSGLMAHFMCGQMKKHVPPMLNSMNKALKDLAEKPTAS